jgi:DNA primase
MTTSGTLADLAAEYHKALPGRIRQYLYRRGIPDLLIDFHLLGWNGSRITVPIFNREGELAFFKLARDPEDRLPGPKMMTTPGAHAELYGWGEVLKKPTQIVICEGEFDRLVLEAKGFTAVTSTGGAGVFRAEWAKDFQSIPEVYICFDNDDAGKDGADRVARLIPHAKLVELPRQVGDGGDVTDFFIVDLCTLS